MLRHLGDDDGARRIEGAIDAVCEDGRVRTGDLGGTATTIEVGDAIRAALQTQPVRSRG